MNRSGGRARLARRVILRGAACWAASLMLLLASSALLNPPGESLVGLVADLAQTLLFSVALGLPAAVLLALVVTIRPAPFIEAPIRSALAAAIVVGGGWAWILAWLLTGDTAAIAAALGILPAAIAATLYIFWSCLRPLDSVKTAT